jgi:hypothetical protein
LFVFGLLRVLNTDSKGLFIAVKASAGVPEFTEEKDENECAEETKKSAQGRPEDAEKPEEGLEDVVNGNVHIVRFLFGIMCIVQSYARNVCRFQHWKLSRAHRATCIA